MRYLTNNEAWDEVTSEFVKIRTLNTIANELFPTTFKRTSFKGLKEIQRDEIYKNYTNTIR
jgi:hypothetical protein